MLQRKGRQLRKRKFEALRNIVVCLKLKGKIREDNRYIDISVDSATPISDLG
jgi:hypothetical protein